VNKIKFYNQDDEKSLAGTLNMTPKIIIRIETTSEITGYTIQALNGLNYDIFSDRVVIVPTYKANILSVSLDKDNKVIEQKIENSFNLTRDAWYNLGKNSFGKYRLLNRAFVPANYNQNLYSLKWTPNYPIKGKIFASGADAFILTRFGDRKIPAKPLETQKHLDGTPIENLRSDENFATDVMLHIGGTYEVYIRGIGYKFIGYDHVGGSYGCFCFIPEDDIHSTVDKAKKAIENDDYDDNISNTDWKKTADEIKNLAFPEKKELQLILMDRDESKNHYPTEILSE
jgi:hypothetical protein